MQPEILRAELARLGLSQTAAAKLLGVNRTSVERWATGALDMPRWADRMLYLLRTSGDALDLLRRLDAEGGDCPR